MANDKLTITLNKGSYGASDGLTPLNINSFNYAFAANGGTATSWTPTSITKVGGAALTGGETSVEVNGTLGGTADGNETVAVTPKDATSVYDANGNAMDAAQSMAATMKIGSIIVMQDDFAGTTIDAAKWTKNDAADELDVSQNNLLEFTANASPASAIDAADNNGTSKYTFAAGSGKQSYQYGLLSFAGDANAAKVIPILRLHDGTLNNRIQVDQNTDVGNNDKVRFRIWLGGVSQYDFKSTISLVNVFKVEIDGTSISLYYLNASTWTKIGATQTVDFTGITFSALLGATIGTNAVITDTAKVDNYYQTNYNYLSAVPS